MVDFVWKMGSGEGRRDLSNPVEGKQPAQQDRNASQEVKREIIEFAKMIAWFLVVFFVVKTYVIEGYEVQGPSMQPTLQDRERILVLKLPYVLSQFRLFGGIEALKPGNIVVFDSPVEANKRYVKRVIAKGAPANAMNTVSAKQQGAAEASANRGIRVVFDHGTVYVNNRRLAEDYLPAEDRSVDERSEETYLQPGTYYVLGDNRGVSKDSRSFGSIEGSCVTGRAILCFWPPSRIRVLK